tara:strand:+ start:148 stop:624 length:477 start_codon:yes stop_codon:yes gene_type:complete
MNIPSPFEGLDIDRETVCEFFATFSRVEFSLKEMGYSRNVRGVISPAWRRFAEDMSQKVQVEADSPLGESIRYLCAEPPMVQVDAKVWQQQDLYGQTRFEQAIDAACRVRHNLFHGGKHTPHSPPGRDQKLATSALCVLIACINSDEELYDVYVHNRF